MEQWCFSLEMQRKGHCIMHVMEKKLMSNNYIT